MIYCTRRTFILSTVVFVLTDMGLSNYADDMNNILTTAYTIKKSSESKLDRQEQKKRNKYITDVYPINQWHTRLKNWWIYTTETEFFQPISSGKQMSITLQKIRQIMPFFGASKYPDSLSSLSCWSSLSLEFPSSSQTFWPSSWPWTSVSAACSWKSPFQHLPSCLLNDLPFFSSHNVNLFAA